MKEIKTTSLRENEIRTSDKNFVGVKRVAAENAGWKSDKWDGNLKQDQRRRVENSKMWMLWKDFNVSENTAIKH